MKTFKIVAALVVLLVVTSCNNKQTLQEYYVDSKDNADFIMVDLPASLIAPDSELLTQEQREVLKTVKKVNMLAYPLNTGSRETYLVETAKVQEILDQDSYEELMKFGKSGQHMRLFLKGEVDSIDEVVVFAQDDEKGFLLARLLGDDMNVGDMVRFAETIDQNGAGFNTSQFEGVMDVFANK